jgi:hypothetical protein
MSNILIGITNVVLFFFWGFFAGGPSVAVKAPSAAKPGESFLVEVIVSKGDYADFARLLQKMPEGFTATAVENDGAKFLFEDGAAKFIWTTTPAKSELKVSYRVTVAQDASGDKQITGKYSYAENGASTFVTSDPVTINISNSSTPVASGNEGGNTTTPVNPVDTMSKPAAVIAVNRTMPAEAVNTFDVEVTVDKADLSKFGKLEETLPAGCTATALTTDGSKFEMDGQVAKFSWFGGMPAKSSLRVSYRVTVAPGTSGDQPISGIFSYIENEKSMTTSVAANTIKITPPAEPVATTSGAGDGGNKTPDNGNSTPVNENTTTAANTNTSAGDGGNKTPENGNSTTTNTATNTTANTTTNLNNTNTSGDNGNAAATGNSSTGDENKTLVTTTPSVSGLSYRIQIAALSRNASPSEFANRFGLSERIDAEQHDGLNKYLVGNFNAYQEARNKREDIRGKGASDAFVTAYNSGRRITVQEALMISKQQWVR